jgi:hypothetical protein
MAQGTVQEPNGAAVPAGAPAKASNGLPAWLNSDTFQVPQFDADACISDLRRYVRRSCSSLRGARTPRRADHGALRAAMRGCFLRRPTPPTSLPAPAPAPQVPLSTLKQELDTYLANLKNKVRAAPAQLLRWACCTPPGVQRATSCRAPARAPQLVEVINEDYGDYVSLSSRLVNVDGSVIRMRRPLLDLKVRRRARLRAGCRPAGWGWPGRLLGRFQ